MPLHITTWVLLDDDIIIMLDDDIMMNICAMTLSLKLDVDSLSQK